MKLENPLIPIGTLSVILLFSYIKHQNSLIDLSYKTQKAEQALIQLKKKREAIQQELLILKNHDAVKKRAEKELGMKPTKTSQIRYLDRSRGVSS